MSHNIIIHFEEGIVDAVYSSLLIKIKGNKQAYIYIKKTVHKISHCTLSSRCTSGEGNMVWNWGMHIQGTFCIDCI